ncbi:Ldh family oxidoreductase [Streptomyces griseorubiginosus]|uniref:Delta(1)-pyrroline-2-carboxylate/Delta(1)-piperideine-2-carboxylate reductase n=1 Tax=Streptomyces griseorubiginosus TaxID=67304 RepID=A0AAI8L5X6_9ACTN|nr:Ldh family oxidoreductase [Streptomyces griseorubiginosus]AYC41789.1 Delta(1)-pyrroline-2-carboxylate/Delta(1)-piperideine-2-carboxylate reductase [Streptomyces griseorubiginosus]
MQVPIEKIMVAVISLLEQRGLNGGDAQVVCDHLVTAETRGYPSHGLSRLPAILRTLEGCQGQCESTLQKVTSSTAQYEANGKLGIIAVTEAVGILNHMVKSTGLSMIAVTGYVGTTGSIGQYVQIAAEQNIIMLATSSSEYAVAPYGSRRAILGTNPMAIGFPLQPDAVVADVATAAWSYGDLRLAMTQGRQIPAGVVQTIDGEASTDPNDADNGSQLPMAGHKGYALGLAMELLCGPFAGGKAGRDAVNGTDATLLIGFRADLFRDNAEVSADAMALAAEIHAAPLAQTFDEVLLPGEGAARRRRQNLRNGYLEVNDEILGLTRIEP